MQRKKQLNLIFCDRQESPTKRKEVGFAVHNCQMISIFVGPHLGENQYRPRLLFPVPPPRYFSTSNKFLLPILSYRGISGIKR